MNPPREEALALDRDDPLASFRALFHTEDRTIYLDGNSLGRLPQATVTLTRDLVERGWGRDLIASWNAGWMDLPRRLGAKIARIIGADDDEVLLADSTSVNLFKLTVAALRARPDRRVIVTDDLNFPSDLYVLQSAAELLGPDYRVEVISADDGMRLTSKELAASLDSRVALVALSAVAFKSGFFYDLPAITRQAHEAGALMLWDLSHAVGAVPLQLSQTQADLAVGCTYKYLNGGPGAPAFLYVRRELQQLLHNPIAGWFGRAEPFGFDLAYAPADGLARFLTGTPPILSLAAIEPGLDLVLEAGLPALRAKSLAQSEYLIRLFDHHLESLGFVLKSPRRGEERGSHVALGHPEAWRINRALIDRERVVPDFRLPDNLRLGICPLYTTFTEIHDAVMAMRRVVEQRDYEKYEAERSGVT